MRLAAILLALSGPVYAEPFVLCSLQPSGSIVIDIGEKRLRWNELDWVPAEIQVFGDEFVTAEWWSNTGGFGIEVLFDRLKNEAAYEFSSSSAKASEFAECVWRE